MISAVSCSEEAKTLIPMEESSTDGSSTSDSTVTSNTALYFRLGLKWEGVADSASFTDWAEDSGEACNISADSPLVDRSITCNFTVPEAQLYYSQLQFKMGTKTVASCPIIKFRPYYYQRSNLAPVEDDPGTPGDDTAPGYIPPGEDTDYDCSKAEDPQCFGGAAPTLVPDFPENRGVYTLSHVAAESAYVLPAENTLRYYGGTLVNYLATNNLSSAARALSETGTAARKERVANTYVDYRVSCENYWGETLYDMTLKISDENFDDAGGNDDYDDWD